jgi:hypothetical protein
MDDKTTLLQLAKIFQALFDLQVNEVKSTAALAQLLEPKFPGLSVAIQAARNTAPFPESQALTTLRQQIQQIVDDLSR